MDIGKFYKGEVESVNDDGSVTVRWADGSMSILPRKKMPRRPDTWPVPGDKPCSDPMCACAKLTPKEQQG